MGERGIYQIRNVVNGHRYIGQTTNLNKRRGEHLRGLRRGAGINPHLQAAWRKYGAPAFVFEVLAQIESPITKLELTDLEQDYVDFFLPEYNMLRECTASTRGYKHTAESRARMSAAGKGKPKSPEHRAAIGAAQRGRPRLGHPNSEAFRSAMSERLMGNRYGAFIPSDETRAKMSAWQIGHAVSQATREKLSLAMKGRTISPEHKAKISAALARRRISEETRAKLSEAKRRYWAARREGKHGGG